jgi:hypothetical protein
MFGMRSLPTVGAMGRTGARRSVADLRWTQTFRAAATSDGLETAMSPPTSHAPRGGRARPQTGLGRVGLPFACLVLSALGLACPPPPTSPDERLCGGGDCPPPPPKPGDSLTSSELCTCRACEPRSCCVEKTDDGSGGGCEADGYNFAANERCGLSVQSCQSRCFQHRWRADRTKGCAASKPVRCCD